MSAFLSALWAEALKARRSKITPLTAGGLSILPLVGGLFMIILKDPERARALGLIGVKAQLTAGVADWPTFLGIINQGTAVGGGILFALITAWVFGREFSDHTVKELLALPTPRPAIVAAKLTLVAVWTLALALLVFALGLLVGRAVDIPGLAPGLLRTAFLSDFLAALLTVLLMPFVALAASAGRGYLPAMGWTFGSLALAQIIAVLGWGDWFPWTVPALLSGMAGPSASQVGLHSYILVVLASLVGATATFLWWSRADQAR